LKRKGDYFVSHADHLLVAFTPKGGCPLKLVPVCAYPVDMCLVV